MLTINGKSQIQYVKSTVKINMDKPFKSPSGFCYNTERTIETSNGDRRANISSIAVKNISGYTTFNKDSEDKTKAAVSIPASSNPIVTSFMDCLYQGYVDECTRLEIPLPKPLVSRNVPNPKKQGEYYPDSSFIQIKLGIDYPCCYTKIVAVEDGNLKTILSNVEFDEGNELSTIREYVKEALKINESDGINLISEVYGVNIEITDKQKKTFKVTGKPKCNFKLLEPSNFSDIMKNYEITDVYAKMKPIYIREGTKTFATIVSSRIICKRRAASDKEIEDDFEQYTKELCSNRDSVQKELEEVDPTLDDFE